MEIVFLLKNIPIGTNIHNIELKPGAGAQLIDLQDLQHKLFQKKHLMFK